ncbi:hypothetical protein ACPV5W_00460 [Vibrio astriarenae]
MSELILGYKDADVDVLPILATKKVPELQTFADNILELFAQTQVFVDNKPIETGRFFGISGPTLANELANVSGRTDKFITVRSSGILSSRSDTISVQFPETLGDVELHIVRPLRPNLEPGEASPTFVIQELNTTTAYTYYKVSNVMDGISQLLTEPSLILLTLLACYMLLNAQIRLAILIISCGFIIALVLLELGIFSTLDYPIWMTSLLIGMPFGYLALYKQTTLHAGIIATLLIACIFLLGLTSGLERINTNQSTEIAIAYWFVLTVICSLSIKLSVFYRDKSLDVSLPTSND